MRRFRYSQPRSSTALRFVQDDIWGARTIRNPYEKDDRGKSLKIFAVHSLRRFLNEFTGIAGTMLV
jgi:hypothetical protein